MKVLVIITLFLLIARIALAQKNIDTALANMPMVKGRLVYTDTIVVKQHSKAILDTAAKKWFVNYFKMYRPDTLSKDKDANSTILDHTALEFKIATTSLGLVKYKFYLIFTIKIFCKDNYYTHKIFDIYFKPESKFFGAIGVYQTSPEYLINLYNQKHLGIEPAIDLGRKKIAEYLTCVNGGVQNCIKSLNQAMAN